MGSEWANQKGHDICVKLYKWLAWCQHFCRCSSFLSPHRKWSLMSSSNTVEVIIPSTNCPKGLRTRWSGLIGAMVPLSLNHFIFNVSQTFLCCDKMLTGPCKKKFVFTFLISAHYGRELERHSATYNMMAGGIRVSHNWKWPKQDAASHNPSLITCILTPASSPRIFLTSNSGTTI